MSWLARVGILSQKRTWCRRLLRLRHYVLRAKFCSLNGIDERGPSLRWFASSSRILGPSSETVSSSRRPKTPVRTTYSELRQFRQVGTKLETLDRMEKLCSFPTETPLLPYSCLQYLCSKKGLSFRLSSVVHDLCYVSRLSRSLKRALEVMTYSIKQ